MCKTKEEYFGKIKFFKIIQGFCILAIILILLFFSGLNGIASPKFLILHLDGVSSQNFFQYMENGDLPNMKEVFADGHMIHHGLSLFPGGTEMAVPHLKEGTNNSTGGAGWSYYDRDKEKKVPSYKVFLKMFSGMQRRAKACFIYGTPGLDPFMFLPLLNVPELLETYGVIQFYWFTTDALGHVMGPELYKASIQRFDRYFGCLVKRLHLDDTNIIIYCDHGMSFGRDINAHQKTEIERIVGDNLRIFLRPHVYLKNPDKKDKAARDIVLESEIDFAFYRDNSHRVVGYWNRGKMIFEEESGKIRYLFEGEDALDYYNAGYLGEWLTDLEWLALTKKSKFPGVPPNIYHLFSNEKVGDVVIVINPPKIPIFNLRYPGNHAGLTNTDLMMPILLRGPQLEHLYDRDEMWLHNLYTSIPELSFEDNEPAREKNSFSLCRNGDGGHDLGFKISLSPAYRWKYNFDYTKDNFRSFLEYDIYSSYFMRLWMGAGIKYQEKETLPFVQPRLQLDYGKIQFNCSWQYDREGWQENTKEIVYQINDRIALEWFIPYRVGMSFSW